MNKTWIVEYVELDDRKPFEEFILSLTVKERAKIFETIDYFLELKNRNLPIKANLSKHLEDGIFELRTDVTHCASKRVEICHCEPPDAAKQSPNCTLLRDCFGKKRLAMTKQALYRFLRNIS